MVRNTLVCLGSSAEYCYYYGALLGSNKGKRPHWRQVVIAHYWVLFVASFPWLIQSTTVYGVLLVGCSRRLAEGSPPVAWLKEVRAPSRSTPYCGFANT